MNEREQKKQRRINFFILCLKTCCQLDECLFAVTYLTTKRPNAFFPRNLALIYQVSYVMVRLIIRKVPNSIRISCRMPKERFRDTLTVTFSAPRTEIDTHWIYPKQLDLIVDPQRWSAQKKASDSDMRETLVPRSVVKLGLMLNFKCRHCTNLRALHDFTS